ncbi:MAG: SPOR domain-containing protein, partial [Proteobacteria bacterium]|nr:SPOR domain-containing protein [Pseudomonadota bacterium]
TKDKNKADRIVRMLRRQKFDSYLAQVNIEGQTIYRVRVGKKSKAEIEKLDQDLQKVIGGMGMKSRKIKLN